MADFHRTFPARECSPPEYKPAAQPRQPGQEECAPLPTTTTPTLTGPKTYPGPSEGCNCPTNPATGTNCLETLIQKQAADILVGDRAKNIKTELEALLASAKKASQDYSRDLYKSLVDAWREQDRAIAELLRKLECAVPCWHCILDCYVCPLLYEVYSAEKWLYDDWAQYSDVHSLYDLQYWLQRDKVAKQRRFDRIKSVLSAWSAPAATIKAALDANRGLRDSALKVLGTEPGKAIYDVFFKLVPMHLAIAAPATNADTTTRIGEEFTKFCGFTKGKADDCCGPDVGEWSLRQRLIKPQPYLIDPNDYFTLICCLIEPRYGPAKEALGKSEAELAAVTERISGYEAQLTNDAWTKAFEANAKAAIPSVIDCCDYAAEEGAAPTVQKAF